MTPPWSESVMEVIFPDNEKDSPLGLCARTGIETNIKLSNVMINLADFIISSGRLARKISMATNSYLANNSSILVATNLFSATRAVAVLPV
jgi:hypothetical protein